MTMIDDVAHRTGNHSGATWVEVEPDFWVGNADGAFLGTIERHKPSRYFARDAARQYVGEYPALILAQSAIVGRTVQETRGGTRAPRRRAPRG
jgi:hypothetical protein